MSYIITNGITYVSNRSKGKDYFLTTDSVRATTWSEEGAAKRFLMNVSSKLIRKKSDYKVIEKPLPVSTRQEPPILPQDTTQLTYEEMRSLIKNKNYIKAKIFDLDKEQQDLLHLIEFEKLNACNGYLMYKRLHLLREERRKYKNQLKIIEAIEPMSMMDYLNGKLSTTLAEIQNQEYKPRILTKEFKDKGWCSK